MKKLFSFKSFYSFIYLLLVLGCASNKIDTTGDIAAKIADIRKMGEERQVKSVKYLINEVKHSNSDVIRIEAINALGKIGDSKAIPILKNIDKKEKNHNIRDAAKEALILIEKANLKNGR